MTLLAMVLAGLFGGSPAVVDRRYELDGWTMTVRDDRFAATRACVLAGKQGTMAYQPGAVGLRVRSPATPGAVYRVDGGPPVRWADRYPALVAAGVEVDGGGLDSPTGRIVWVPLGDVATARTVAVRVGERGWGRRFRLGGLRAMLASAAGLGCSIRPAF